MYEGFADLRKAEVQYLHYVERKPNNKFAVLRLAAVYERLAEPEKAIPHLKQLVMHRHSDWSLVEYYLDYLSYMHDPGVLAKEQAEIARLLVGKKGVHQEDIENLFWEAYLHARWTQDVEKAHSLLIDLIQISDKPKAYEETLLDLDLSLGRTHEALASLGKRLQTEPQNEELRLGMVGILSVIKDYKESLRILNEGLLATPKSLGLMEARADLFETMGQKLDYEQDLKALLQYYKAGTPKLKDALYRLASFYQEEKRYDEAVEYFDALIQEEGGTKPNQWLSLASLLAEAKQTQRAFEVIARYQELFGKDKISDQMILEIHLYVNEDVDQLDYYRGYIAQYGDTALGLEVANLLVSKKREGEGLAWLSWMQNKGLVNAEVLKLFGELSLNAGLKSQALATYEKLHQMLPTDVPITLTLVALTTEAGNKERAVALLDDLAGSGASAQTLKIAGREMLFLGNPKRSGEVLQRSIDLNPQDPETWFWASEADHTQDFKLAARIKALKVLELFSGRKLTEQELMMSLKAQGRVRLSDDLFEKYTQAINYYPKNRDLRTDEMDLLIEAKSLKTLEDQMDRFKSDFPDEADRILPYEVRLNFEKRRWRDAVVGLERILVKNPLQWAYRRDLADALAKSGQWKRALQEYDLVQKETGNDLKVARPIHELEKRYDSRVSGFFTWQDLGDDSSLVGSAFYREFWGNDWETLLESSGGVYKVPRLGFDGDAQFGEASLYRHFSQGYVNAGMSFGTTEHRTIFGPTAGFGFYSAGLFNVDVDAAMLQLRHDIPSAVALGVKQDHVNVTANYSPINRLGVGFHYRVERDVLPNGDSGVTHLVEPSVNYRIFDDPGLSIGYQYTYNRVLSEGAYLTTVGLVPETNAHYLNVSMDYAPNDKIRGEVSFFAGEDLTRNLHLFEGDLFGVHGALEWSPTPWLDLTAAYDMGSETLLGVGGKSHQLKLGVSGHWR